MIATGYLRINVYDEQMTPVTNAHVTIYDGETGQIVKNFSSNRNGRSEEIALNAPDASFTMQSTTIRRPYALYHAEANQEGYDITVIRNIQIFAETASQLAIIMQKQKGTAPERNVIDLGEHTLFVAGNTEYA